MPYYNEKGGGVTGKPLLEVSQKDIGKSMKESVYTCNRMLKTSS